MGSMQLRVKCEERQRQRFYAFLRGRFVNLLEKWPWIWFIRTFGEKSELPL
jgi:hypothetical protein